MVKELRFPATIKVVICCQPSASQTLIFTSLCFPLGREREEPGDGRPQLQIDITDITISKQNVDVAGSHDDRQERLQKCSCWTGLFFISSFNVWQVIGLRITVSLFRSSKKNYIGKEENIKRRRNLLREFVEITSITFWKFYYLCRY